jgi:hypothetical protein
MLMKSSFSERGGAKLIPFLVSIKYLGRYLILKVINFVIELVSLATHTILFAKLGLSKSDFKSLKNARIPAPNSKLSFHFMKL